jgi:cyclic pyranopterin phosphate synthase
MATHDRLGRPLRNLRISVTDRCNLRCAYCMPEAEYAWLPREDILHFEEIGRLVDAFTGLGVDKVRLTGGEPLVRRDCTASPSAWTRSTRAASTSSPVSTSCRGSSPASTPRSRRVSPT